jgi:putative tryptophan/tyrosine transport system substrate-binding protein
MWTRCAHANEAAARSFGECFERAVPLADRILKGAKPGELPFERPTGYKFAVNVKTAKTLGLEIPQSVMASADIVIE